MTDRTAPGHLLAAEIAAREAEIEAALAACPARQRFEVEGLRQRLERLKASQAVAQPVAPARPVSLR